MWTEDQDNELFKLKAAGKSQSEIANLMQEIKPGVTKSAIAGRISRLHLSAPKIHKIIPKFSNRRYKETTLSRVGVYLKDIKSDQCHKPVGPHGLYCGKSGVNRPNGYCPECFKLVYQTIKR